MRVLLILFLLTACLSCRPGAQPASETVTGTVAAGGKLLTSPKDNGSSEGALVLKMSSAEAVEGQRVCLPVEASSFTDLIGFQYTIRFDSAALRYEEVRNFKLTGYGTNSFGVRFVERGYLSSLWTENNLKAVSIPEATPIFEVCFTNLQPAGQSTEVKFQDGPTAFEVIGADMTERKLKYANGVVRSK